MCAIAKQEDRGEGAREGKKNDDLAVFIKAIMSVHKKETWKKKNHDELLMTSTS